MSQVESRQPSENTAIPKHWKFPGRDNPGLKVIQFDLKEGFLAYTLPDYFPRSRFYFSSDIFFGSGGNPVNIRAKDSLSSSIHIFSGNRDVQNLCSITGEAVDNISSKQIFMVSSLFEVNAPVPSDLSGVILNDTFRGGEYFWHGADYFEFKLATGEFLDLEQVTLFRFNQREKKIMEESPVITFYPSSSNLGKIKYDYFRHKNFTAKAKDQDNSLSFLNEEGELIYKLDWRIEHQGEDESVFLVQYKQVPTEITKTLQVPLKVDPKKNCIRCFIRTTLFKG